MDCYFDYSYDGKSKQRADLVVEWLSLDGSRELDIDQDAHAVLIN